MRRTAMMPGINSKAPLHPGIVGMPLHTHQSVYDGCSSTYINQASHGPTLWPTMAETLVSQRAAANPTTWSTAPRDSNLRPSATVPARGDRGCGCSFGISLLLASWPPRSLPTATQPSDKPHSCMNLQTRNTLQTTVKRKHAAVHPRRRVIAPVPIKEQATFAERS